MFQLGTRKKDSKHEYMTYLSETLVQGFTFDLHHLANPKSPKANYILEFLQAANLITKFSDLDRNYKKYLKL